MSQPEIAVINDFQTLVLIQNGAIVLEREEDFELPITYRAIAVDSKLAYMRSTETGRVLIENIPLMVTANSVIAMCV
ncbi:hypothetical protein [Chamaesiphon minutus]|jgi:hypothetical protein|uniref:Uncharacterized protein n=1 Tax=Chamaesiphon minutus (strain ATCC 27169 / PCC 6605) TaxID=1173020 RepID=K9UE60_CHAP6|nr:hypothetical protein [Chamaesiphon minutus]AFY92923.1 hypothetical protein Cha6605_1802 [Chamaesiphon minutus PCC 6605]